MDVGQWAFGQLAGLQSGPHGPHAVDEALIRGDGAKEELRPLTTLQPQDPRRLWNPGTRNGLGCYDTAA